MGGGRIRSATITAKPARPKAAIVDDEMANVLVELDADLDAIATPKPPTVAAGRKPVGAKPDEQPGRQASEPRKRPTPLTSTPGRPNPNANNPSKQ